MRATPLFLALVTVLVTTPACWTKRRQIDTVCGALGRSGAVGSPRERAIHAVRWLQGRLPEKSDYGKTIHAMTYPGVSQRASMLRADLQSDGYDDDCPLLNALDQADVECARASAIEHLCAWPWAELRSHPPEAVKCDSCSPAVKNGYDDAQAFYQRVVDAPEAEGKKLLREAISAKRGTCWDEHSTADRCRALESTN